MTLDTGHASITAELRRFVCETFLLDEGAELDEQAGLLEEGILDSTGILEMVEHLEEHYGISVRDEEIVPENFASLRSIGLYVQRCLDDGGER